MSVDDASAALGAVRSTLLVVGTQGEQGPHFMVANWGTQASFDPWRYVIAIKKTARTLRFLQEHGAFTINLLDEERKALVKEAMKKRGGKLEAAKGALDAPRLQGSFAGWDCQLLQVVDTGGDHVLVVADVKDGWKGGDGPALTLGDLDLSYGG
jgi:flavin reductase (DIM6/NTAB) family NADH-FMN oxidoreductase RutF